MAAAGKASVARRGRIRPARALMVAGAVAFVALVFAMLARVEPIQVVSSRLDRAGDQVSVEGVLRNTGPDAGAVSLEVSYYDSQGRKLAADAVPVGRLRSGAKIDFSSPARRLEDVQSFSVYVDRGRNPYGN
ncbi:MAG: FxLYD domain-containing protein [Candidatus Binatales bacterium]